MNVPRQMGTGAGRTDDAPLSHSGPAGANVFDLHVSRRPNSADTSTRSPAREVSAPTFSDQQALTCQLALAHGDPHADEPDSGDFLRQQLPAAHNRDTNRVRVYGLCAKRAFRAEQARVKALTTRRPDDDGPIAA